MAELPQPGIRIMRNVVADTTQAYSQNILPVINSTSLPPNLIPQLGAGLAYDSVTKRVYYNNGQIWIPLAPAGSLPGSVFSYAFIKDGAKTIPPNTPTVVDLWTLVPSPPNHDNTAGWNLTTGVYTASTAQTISLNVDLSWAANISNLGFRMLQIMYQPFAGVPIVAREASTQADPAIAVETTQETSTFLEMNPGDQAWIQVMHNAPLNLVLSSGNKNAISGIKINP